MSRCLKGITKNGQVCLASTILTHCLDAGLRLCAIAEPCVLYAAAYNRTDLSKRHCSWSVMALQELYAMIHNPVASAVCFCVLTLSCCPIMHCCLDQQTGLTQQADCLLCSVISAEDNMQQHNTLGRQHLVGVRLSLCP